MAFPRPFTLLLFLLASARSLPLGCTDIPGSSYCPVNRTEVEGSWNVIAGAYNSSQDWFTWKAKEYSWMKVDVYWKTAGFILVDGLNGSILFSKEHKLKFSEACGGVTFTGLETLATVNQKVSEDCITINFPGHGALPGIILVCRSHAANKSVVENFIHYATCHNYAYTHVYQNFANHASVCKGIPLHVNPMKLREIAGRWILTGKAAFVRCNLTDGNRFHDWIEFTAHGDEKVTLARNPDSKNLDEIVEGEYDNEIFKLSLKQAKDFKHVNITIQESFADYLILTLEVDSRRTLLMFSSSGTVSLHEKMRFLTQAFCRSFTYFYRLLDDPPNAEGSVPASSDQPAAPAQSTSAPADAGGP
ncbi:uncharacterized protein LOC115081053 [Rhinatrema bivittatum]|uniref:uncharacterized protein LOC115081053 n=1 Tax=Rhinatrema bivittatum TaxID=194408 RepID=UPI00112E230B|nr:uncharacterized protein LOC115081053 [Rhinatrema bivittatum]